jgi:hypothetical protein
MLVSVLSRSVYCFPSSYITGLGCLTFVCYRLSFSLFPGLNWIELNWIALQSFEVATVFQKSSRKQLSYGIYIPIKHCSGILPRLWDSVQLLEMMVHVPDLGKWNGAKGLFFCSNLINTHDVILSPRGHFASHGVQNDVHTSMWTPANVSILIIIATFCRYHFKLKLYIFQKNASVLTAAELELKTIHLKKIWAILQLILLSTNIGHD